jgi:hypothetical protein
MGEYIAIHHSDDMWMPGKLEQQIDFLRKNEECGAIFTNAQAIEENGVGITDEAHIYANIFNKRNRSRYEWLNYFFTNGNTLCHPSVVIRKKCFEDCGLYRYGLAQLGDFDMWVRLCMKYEIHVTDKKLVKFRVRDNEENASGNTLDMRSRIFTEQYFIIKNYLHLSKYEELLKVFPEANEYRTENEPVLEYVLARVIISRGGDALSILFALELLFHVINDPQKSELVYRQYGFAATDFVDLTKKYGVANNFVRDVEEDQQEIRSLSCKLEVLKSEHEVLKSEHEHITSTLSWRLTNPLRVVEKLFRRLFEFRKTK